MDNKNSDFEDLKLKIEAILFSFGDEISEIEIGEIINIDSKNLVQTALEELRIKFENNYSFKIIKIDQNKWKMGLKEEFEEITNKIISNTQMPNDILKVLSVIAYEQPITKTKLSEILGKSVKSKIEYLYNNDFVNYKKIGIGKYYRVTKKFYDYFKLNEQEFRDIMNKKIENSTKILDDKNDVTSN